MRAYTTPEGRWRLDAKPEDVSATYLSLLFAFEDRRFWTHPGVDPLALCRAVLQAIRHGRLISGGSTLTMQVARLLRGSPTHSISAKFQQIADAARLEWALSKREILSLYLKLAPLWRQSRRRARRLARLFRQGAAAAHRSPRRPFSSRSRNRPKSRRPDRGYGSLVEGRNRVIRSAAAAHAIAEADAKAAVAQPAPRGRRDFPALAPHLSDRLLAAQPNEPVVATTNRPDLAGSRRGNRAPQRGQAFGEKISIAALIVNNSTGEVLAHVGSAGYFDDTRLGAIDMTAAIRSPGSALKPFIYGLAFEDGLAHPETLIEDRPVALRRLCARRISTMCFMARSRCGPRCSCRSTFRR